MVRVAHGVQTQPSVTGIGTEPTSTHGKAAGDVHASRSCTALSLSFVRQHTFTQTMQANAWIDALLGAAQVGCALGALLATPFLLLILGTLTGQTLSSFLLSLGFVAIGLILSCALGSSIMMTLMFFWLALDNLYTSLVDLYRWLTRFLFPS